MLKKIAIGAVVIVAAVLASAATNPDYVHFERSASIGAPPETIQPLITDFRQWRAWSPYEKRDPALRRTFSGAPSGQGAVYEWNGNDEVGQGRMEITESVPTRVAIKLDFIRPFEGHNVAEFTLRSTRGHTAVTWAMHGPNSYIGKLMSVFIDMDQMIGRDFETGLANLKSIAESTRGQS
jgi:uncharacterized protein YndB with AHSA1/START domain